MPHRSILQRRQAGVRSVRVQLSVGPELSSQNCFHSRRVRLPPVPSSVMVQTVPMAGRREHEWRVAGALIEQDGLLLLVANRRRGGSLEWTPPGGVIDAGETSQGALAREVREETGLIVESWSSMIYEVSVDFPERGMPLGVEVFMADSWHGAMVFADPDGIVEEGRFVDPEEGSALLRSAPRWVNEPVCAWLAGETRPGMHFDYLATGTDPAGLTVERR